MQEEKQMFHFKEEVDMNAWYNNPDPDFAVICELSRVPPDWKSYQLVLNSQFSTSIIKPINNYAEFMGSPPSLVSVEGNTVRLRQGNMAEIYVLEPTKDDTTEEFSAIDRPWIRQFYPSLQTEQYPTPEGCFDHLFKFYTPWFIDENIADVTFEQPLGVDSPFTIHTTKGSFFKQRRDAQYVEPHFIPFHFNMYGDHMHDPGEFTIIKGNSPMYDIVIRTNGIIVNEIKEFYERHQVLPIQ